MTDKKRKLCEKGSEEKEVHEDVHQNVRKSQCQNLTFSGSKGSKMLDCTILIIKISFLGDPIDCMGGDISGGEVSIYLSIYSYICILSNYLLPMFVLYMFSCKNVYILYMH